MDLATKTTDARGRSKNRVIDAVPDMGYSFWKGKPTLHLRVHGDGKTYDVYLTDDDIKRIARGREQYDGLFREAVRT